MSKLLKPADWTFPVPIKYGPGRIDELGELCRQAQINRPLIVTDRGSRDLLFISKVLSSMNKAGFAGEMFSEVDPNPSDVNVKTGRDIFLGGGHDGIIAIGGGSGMDAGKAISLVVRNDLDLWQFDYDKESPGMLNASDFAPLICIPTTSGTGAETESTAMVTNTHRGIKGCVWHPAQKPVAAILDPELTLGLPKTLTAWTGCDALVHAIEALSVPQWHPLCDGLALEAIRMICRWLPVAVRDGNNLEARAAMQVGSCLAGISFLKGLGLVHAISHMVGAVCDTHHGLTNAVLLPLVLQYNKEGFKEKTALMCRAMELPGEDFGSFYQAMVNLLDELEIPGNLGVLGVREKQIPEIANKAFTDAACATNPVAATEADIERLLRQAMNKAR